MQINDKVIRGALIGICANSLKLAFNYICFQIGWSPVVFWQIVATRFMQKDELYKPAAYLIGGTADFITAAILGVVFVFFMDYSSRKYRYLKGAGFGLTIWVGLFGTILGQSVQEKLPVTASTVIVALFAHLIFGLAMALFEVVIKDKKQARSINLSEKLIKNIPFAQTINFASQVDYQEGQVISRTLSQGPNLSLTFFAFDKDEEISSHASSGDALVQILDGQARITIGDQQFQLKQGEAIVMPANIRHALFAVERFKMFLTVVFNN